MDVCLHTNDTYRPQLWLLSVILVVLSLYKCREYGAFSPTLVHYLTIILATNTFIIVNSTKILARDSTTYFVSMTGAYHSSTSTYTLIQSSTGVLVFNLVYARRHTLLSTTLTVYVFWFFAFFYCSLCHL